MLIKTNITKITYIIVTNGFTLFKVGSVDNIKYTVTRIYTRYSRRISQIIIKEIEINKILMIINNI